MLTFLNRGKDLIFKYRHYLGLAAVILFIYSNSFSGTYVSDDMEGIVFNPSVPVFSFKSFQILALLDTICWKIGGGNPVPFHWVGVILHIVNTILVFSLIRIFFGERAAFWGALVFAVHPAHTEVITWLSGRVYLLTAFFTLLPYLLYHRALSNGKSNLACYVLSFSLFYYWLYNPFYGFYVTFPCALILLDIYFRGFRFWKLWIPFILSGAWRFFSMYEPIVARAMAVTGTLEFNPNYWWIYFPYSVFTNLRLLFVPKLAFYHEPVFIHFEELKKTVGSWAACVFPLLVFGGKCRILKELFCFFGLFIIFLFPTFSPIAFSNIIADRYLYLPAICLGLTVALVYVRGCELIDKKW